MKASSKYWNNSVISIVLIFFSYATLTLLCFDRVFHFLCIFEHMKAEKVEKLFSSLFERAGTISSPHLFIQSTNKQEELMLFHVFCERKKTKNTHHSHRTHLNVNVCSRPFCPLGMILFWVTSHPTGYSHTHTHFPEGNNPVHYYNLLFHQVGLVPRWAQLKLIGHTHRNTHSPQFTEKQVLFTRAELQERNESDYWVYIHEVIGLLGRIRYWCNLSWCSTCHYMINHMMELIAPEIR